VRCWRFNANLIQSDRYFPSCRCTVSESGISRSKSMLSKTAWTAGLFSGLLGLFIFVGCENKEKQEISGSSATASQSETAAPSPPPLPAASPVLPVEQGQVQSLTERKQNYLNALEQAKQNNLAAIEQSRENYFRAIEQYKQEYQSTVDRYRSMTPTERALIHSKSLAQIGQDHDMELRQAREEYSAAVNRARLEYESRARPAPSTNADSTNMPDSGEAELESGHHFRYVRYSQGYLVEELCSEITLGRCYPHGWQPWLKELERQTAGAQLNALESDSGMQGAGTLVISWDAQRRALFYGCRPHFGDDACAYFIVGPKTRELDIVWKNEGGVRYLGPNASMLEEAHVYEWLKKLPW